MTQQPGGWGQQPAPQQGWGQPAPQQGWGAPPPQQYGPPQGQQAPWGQQPQQLPAQRPTPPNEDDPFAGATKAPSVSFKDAPIGTTVVMEVTDSAKVVQSRDFDTNALEWWPPEYPGAQPQPKWSVVVNGTVNGEARSLWAAKTSKEGSLCHAIAVAQQEAGFKVAAGTRLSVRLIGEEPPPPDKARQSPRKLYAARLEPGAPGTAGDAFGQQQPAQQAQQAPQQGWGQPPAQQQAPQGPPQGWGQPAPQPGEQGGPPPGWGAPQPGGYGPPQGQPPAQQGPPADPWGQQQAPQADQPPPY